jgi:microcystin-dependent protein
MDPILGEIRVFAFGWTPQGWLPCNGELLSVAEFTALYSLLGTLYGGDGETTFAVPDFRGRAPAHQNPPGISMGQMSGGEAAQAGSSFPTTATLTANFCICVQGMFPQRS